VNEILVQLQASSSAFFRMELGRENIITGDSASEWLAIDSLADRVGRYLRLSKVAVHKVKISIIGDAIPHGM